MFRPEIVVFLTATLIGLSASATEMARPLLLWQGILPYGVEEPANPERRALVEVGQYLQTMDAWRSRIYTGLDHKPRWQAFREDAQSLDRDDFLTQRNQFVSAAPSGRGIGFQFSGDWHDTGRPEREFQFAIEDSGVDHQTLSASGALGQVVGELAFAPGTAAPDNVLSELRLRMNFGTLLFDEMLHSIEQINAAFDHRLNARFPVDPALDLGPHDPEQRLSPLDQRLLRMFIQSIPNVMSVLTEVTRYEQIAMEDSTPEGHPVTRIATRQKVDIERLKERYPDTWHDYRRLLTSSSLTLRMQIDDDHHLWQIRYDAATRMFLIDLALSEGAYVLMNNDGSLTDRRIFPSRLRELDYRFSADLELRLFGLSVVIDELTIDAHYDAGTGQPRWRRTAGLDLSMTRVPHIKVSGALLYILPKWLIDLLIPGTIETLIADSFEHLVAGNHGQGMQLSLRFVEDNERAQLQLNLRAETPFDTLQKLLHPEEANESNVKLRLYRDLRAQFRKDWARMAEPLGDAQLVDYINQLLGQKP